MANHQTRKENRKGGWPKHLNPKARTKAKRLLKKVSARKSRNRPIDDETPYKRLDNIWCYD